MEYLWLAIVCGTKPKERKKEKRKVENIVKRGNIKSGKEEEVEKRKKE